MNDRIPKQEIEKWLDKINNKLKNIETKDDRSKEFLENINAYVYDCKHFLKEGDYMRSFEAVIWAWAWLEIGEKMGFF